MSYSSGCAYTLSEIGRIFSVTRERIRQIESVVIRKLQHPSHAKRLAGFLENPAPMKSSIRKRRVAKGGEGVDFERL